jgi:hypothetical protein
MEQSKAIINLFHPGEPIKEICRKLGVPKTIFIIQCCGSGQIFTGFDPDDPDPVPDLEPDPDVFESRFRIRSKFVRIRNSV